MSEQQTTVCTGLKLIPASQRTPALLEPMAEAFFRDAQRHDPPFAVTVEDVRKKLEKAPRLVVAFAGAEPVAFLSATLPIFLPRARLWAIYIAGVIVAPEVKGEGVVNRLVNELGLGLEADLLVLHTQNHIMAKAIWKGRTGHFPESDRRRELSLPLREDLREMLASIGRNFVFEPASGIVPDEYPHWLYSGPLPANHGHSSFERLTPGSLEAVLCLAFNNQRAVSTGFGEDGAL